VCAVPERQVLSSVDGARILTLDAHDLAAIFQGHSRRRVRHRHRCSGGASRRRDAGDASLAVARARCIARGRGSQRSSGFSPPYVPGHWVPEMIDIAGGWNWWRE